LTDNNSDLQFTDEPTSLDEFIETRTLEKFRQPKFYIIGALAFVGFMIWFIPPVHRLVDDSVTVTQWVKSRGKITAEVGPGLPNWINSSQMSKHTLNAFVAAEDARFYSHIGIDPTEIWHSVKTNFRKGRFARGGSTITQQVVKMAFLSRSKSLIRKSREAVGAIILEFILPKRKILEWYINLAEFGDAVYGVKNGCWHYFRTKPSQLKISQAVHMALVLPSPNGWSQGLRNRKLTEFGHSRFAYILNRMRSMRFITNIQWKNTMANGDFGRPINGYKDMERAIDNDEMLCPGSPDCPEQSPIWDEKLDGLEFPNRSVEKSPPPLEPVESKSSEPVEDSEQLPEIVDIPDAPGLDESPVSSKDPTSQPPALKDPSTLFENETLETESILGAPKLNEKENLPATKEAVPDNTQNTGPQQ
jgi:monofunctional glycosyltransferase